MKALFDHAVTLSTPLPDVSLAAFDSRHLVAGQIFFALQGQDDGHRYVQHAIKAGASAVVVSKDVGALDVPVFRVDNVLDALQSLAQAWRQSMPAQVVGLTGSCGKTSTRHALQMLLQSMGHAVCATQDNLNNPIGVAMTLLSMRAHHVVAVVEMGAGAPGDIATLTQCVMPDIGLVLNARASHLDGLKSLAGVVTTKGELYGTMVAGQAILNSDDAAFETWSNQARHLTIKTFGATTHQPDVGYQWMETDGRQSVWQFQHKDRVYSTQLALLGKHHGSNLSAVLAVGLALGYEMADMVGHLSQIVGFKRRLEVQTSLHGWTVIDDTYNANPASFKAALAALESLPAANKWLVCGDMAALAQQQANYHQRILADIQQMDVAGVVVYGSAFQDAAKTLGMDVYALPDHDAIVAFLIAHAKPDDVVLVKGSRCMQLDRVVDACITQGVHI